MRKLRVGVSAAVLLALSVAAVAVGLKNLKASLAGYQEVPAVSTAADGEFRARALPANTIRLRNCRAGARGRSNNAPTGA